jgi:thioredoxin 1
MKITTLIKTGVSLSLLILSINAQKNDSSSNINQTNTQISQPNSDTHKAITTPEKQLMFFINPNGRPCQMQISIADNMKDKLSGKATIVYIKTTEPADEGKFYQYGIRGLPSLIIADKNGKEIKRLPPGVKDEQTILNALNNK